MDTVRELDNPSIWKTLMSEIFRPHCRILAIRRRLAGGFKISQFKRDILNRGRSDPVVKAVPDFDEGEDFSKYLNLSKVRRPKQEQKRVNVDFPLWMIQLLDKEAIRLGVPRQSIIKVWLAERLEKVS